MYTVYYVLTDSEQLIFYNEMMMSISSLRYYGFDGPVSVLTDHDTKKLLLALDGELKKYGADIIEADIPAKYNQKERSRYLKTNLRSLVSGDFLYVDTDTVFADKLPEIISDRELAMVTDHHYEKLIKNTVTYDYALFYAQKIGIELFGGEPYFNSGVIWAKDTEKTRKLFKEWHEEWMVSCDKGCTMDQPSLNMVNHRMGHVISYLDDRYNVQVTDGEATPFSLLGRSVIIHYFHPNKEQQVYKLAIPEIRNNHYESDIIRDIIMSPKTAFIDGKVITAEAYAEMRNLVDTRQYQLLKKVYAHKKLFAFNERVLKKVVQIYRFFRKNQSR